MMNAFGAALGPWRALSVEVGPCSSPVVLRHSIYRRFWNATMLTVDRAR